MKKYILISNKQKDVEYQYNDFMSGQGMDLKFMKSTHFRVHLIRLSKIFNLESAGIVKELYFNRIFQKELIFQDGLRDEEDMIFILLGRVYERYGSNMLQYIRKKFSRCIVVLYIADTIHSMRFSLDKAKEDFDFIFSFDKGDAEKHGIYYLLEPFSIRLLEKLPEVQEPEYDVTFVGHARNRYDRIILLYETLIKKGLKCNFRITNVPKNSRKYSGEIAYQWTDFEELLMLVKKSRCVLELVQSGGYSATTRYAEAMLLGRNLLTDCRALSEEENKERNIFCFQNIEDIPFEELKKVQSYNRDKYIEKFSVRLFIDKIDKVIESS